MCGIVRAYERPARAGNNIPSMETKKILAIILARGGSKSIPKKNIISVAGKPLIAWTIESARESKKIQRVVVSTDTEEIAAVARDYGADVPFLRPAELAEDHTPDLPAFQHALAWLKEHEHYEPDIVVQLWATSPYRRAGDIDRAIMLLENDSKADSVRSVTQPSQPPFKMWRRDTGPYLSPIMQKEFPEAYIGQEPHSLPRQVLPDVVVQTGYINVIRPRVILSGSMYGTNVIPFYHDPDTYTEVDSYKDLAHTEFVLKKTRHT